MPAVEEARAVYDRAAACWDAARARSFPERPWIDRLLDASPAGAPVLDLGCGSGAPVAEYVAGRGRAVTGVDIAPAMLALARTRLPDAEWIEADIRTLSLDRRFGAIVSWDGVFHLSRDEQRAVLPRIARMLAPGGALLLTVGPEEGEATGRVGDSVVAHASLSADEYRAILSAEGIAVADFVANDAATGGHSIIFARRDARAHEGDFHETT